MILAIVRFKITKIVTNEIYLNYTLQNLCVVLTYVHFCENTIKSILIQYISSITILSFVIKSIIKPLTDA